MDFSIRLPKEICEQIAEHTSQYEAAFVWLRVCKQWHTFCRDYFKNKYIHKLVGSPLNYSSQDEYYRICLKCSDFINSCGLTLIKPLKRLLYPLQEGRILTVYCDKEGQHLSQEKSLFNSKWKMRLLNQIDTQSPYSRRVENVKFNHPKTIHKDCKLLFEPVSAIDAYIGHDLPFIKTLLYLNIGLHISQYVEMNLNFCQKLLNFDSLKSGNAINFCCNKKGVFEKKMSDCICKLFIDKTGQLTKELELLNYKPNKHKDYYLRYQVIHATVTALNQKALA